MIFKLKRPLVPAALVLALAFAAAAGDAAVAAPSGTLIDKNFEDSLIKHFSNRFFNRIHASSEQRQKLSALITQRADETRPLREQMRQEALKLNDLIADDARDDQILAQAQAVRDLRNKVMDERLHTALQARTMLTQDQRQQISQRIHNFLAP